MVSGILRGVRCDINPRYLAYCRAHGMTLDEMLARDRQEYPGDVHPGGCG